MDVLLVNYEMPPIGGGGGKVAFELINNLKGKVSYDVLTSHYPKERIYPNAIEGVTFHCVPSYRASIHQAGPVGMASFLMHASPLIRSLTHNKNYDLIHYFFSIPTGMLSFFQNPSTPYVVSLNGGDVPGYNPEELSWLHSILKGINRNIVRKASGLTVVSANLGQAAEKELNAHSYQVIPNGINVKDYSAVLEPRGFVNNKLKLICVSRLAPWKKVDLILRAIQTLPDIDLEIVGEGACKKQLVNLSKELCIEDRVEFAGYVDNRKIVDHLNKSDVFVLPSIGDSFGIVFLEAMSCGLPIIAARAGGVTEVVRAGVNGILVDPEDIEDLKSAILKLKNDPMLRSQYGKEGRRLAEEVYDWRNISEGYFQVYQKAIDRSYGV